MALDHKEYRLESLRTARKHIDDAIKAIEEGDEDGLLPPNDENPITRIFYGLNAKLSIDLAYWEMFRARRGPEHESETN